MALILQEYKSFMSEAGLENLRAQNRRQTTMDGQLSVEEEVTKPYGFNDSVQQRLVEDVLSCFAETMIPLRALEKKRFDRLVKHLDPRAVVSVSAIP